MDNATYTIELRAEANNDEECELFLAFATMLVALANYTTYQAELIEPVFPEQA